ncbi:Gem-associated protein 5 [Spiromyces aspiralis]|uniref:Gem-associated protein 5 n=1 Tax=Spiromyces aspiralis TaxID=68401 RepID=A0ACC1HS90_9FUNG|nr:Gem-associated protein 5 [Spiromyces aspiralis]
MSETPKQYQVFANSSGIPRCTSWSAGDPSRIFVGFDDQTIQVWDVSNIEGFAPLVESIQAKPAMDIKGDVGPRPGPETSQGATVGKPTAVPANGGMLPPASEGLLSQQMGVHAGSKRPLTIMAAGPNDAPDLLSPQRATKQRKLQAHTRQKQHTKAATLFPLLQAALMSSTRKIQQQRCIDLAEQLYQGKKNDSSGDSGQKEADLCKVLFGNGNIRALIGAESVNHRLSPGGSGLDYTLEVWRGNIGGVFDRIKADTDVTSANLTFLALSPLRKYRGMPPRSTQMLEIFGEKLRDSGDYQTAALCFIGCDKTRQAVEMFERQGMYKEAIILAKARLSPEDDIIPVIYEKWAAQLESKGQLEQAALCYLSANKPTLAVQCTSKRDDLAGLETAKRVAELTGDPAAPECYFRLAIELSRQGEMYDEAIELFEQAKTVRLSGLFATVCRAERYLRSAMGAKAVGNENEGPQGRPWQGAPTPPRLVSELFGENDGSNYSNSTSRLLGFQAEYTTMRPDAIGQAAYYFAMAASVMARGGADPACDEYLSKCRAFLCEVYETGLVEAFISHFTYGF